MKLKLITSAIVVSFALVTGVASAHPQSSNTKVKIDGTKGETLQDFRVLGTVSSPNPKCVADRRVKIISLTPNGPKLIDTDRAGRDGSFSGGGNFGDQVDGIRVKATRRSIGRSGHRLVCEPATDTARVL
jgi:hypothetical protein